MKKYVLSVFIIMSFCCSMFMNVFAGEQNGFITNNSGTIIGYGSLKGNSESAEALTFSYVENQAVTTRIRYASERDLGSWIGGGSLVRASSSGVSGVINMCESYHKVGNFDIGLILYF